MANVLIILLYNIYVNSSSDLHGGLCGLVQRPAFSSIMIGAWLNSRFARYPSPKLKAATRKIIAAKIISFLCDLKNSDSPAIFRRAPWWRAGRPNYISRYP
jgi:uncharacterized membrane protein AbrB (regulator of aidB expression)